MSTTRINDNDLASVALYEKVNAIANEVDAEMVKLTGDQTIDGIKTFTEEVYAPNQLDYSRITNCITHIPQDINLELNDGTLTTKQGSKVWIPYGTTEAYKVGNVDAHGHTVVATSWDGSKFFYAIELQSDVVRGGTWGTSTNTMVITINSASSSFVNFTLGANIYSGDTQPVSPMKDSLWYDTANNLLKTTTDSGATWSQTLFCLPIALVHRTSGVADSKDQVFNGFGYIGSTLFSLPGVKGLIPNGRNADGSLRNMEFTVQQVLVRTFAPGDSWTGTLACGQTWVAITGSYTYDLDENYNKDENGVSLGVNFGSATLTNGVITSFQPKTTFHAVDYNDVVKLTGDQTIDGIKTFTNEIFAPNQLDYSRITNCLTHIPQDIKLELNNSTLILKEESKVYIPNGFEADGTTPKFDVVVIKSDITCTGYQTAGNRLMLYNNNNVYGGVIDFVYSGDTSTMNSKTPYTYAYFYNTQTNKMYHGNGSSWVEVSLSLPLGMATGNSSSQYTSLDQTFNGFGYIGSTLFLLPGVKGLYPNDRNKDGSLKSIEYVSTKVSIVTNPFGASPSPSSCICMYKDGTVGVAHRYVESETAPTTTYTSWYNPKTNKVLYNGSTVDSWVLQEVIALGYLTWDYIASPKTNTFTSLKPKTTFKAVDYNSITKHELVSALPANPVSDTFYYIPE